MLATPREALLIGTPAALPMLLIHRLSRDTGGRPLGRPLRRAALAVTLMAATLLVLLGVSRIRTKATYR